VTEPTDKARAAAAEVDAAAEAVAADPSDENLARHAAAMLAAQQLRQSEREAAAPPAPAAEQEASPDATANPDAVNGGTVTT